MIHRHADSTGTDATGALGDVVDRQKQSAHSAQLSREVKLVGRRKSVSHFSLCSEVIYLSVCQFAY